MNQIQVIPPAIIQGAGFDYATLDPDLAADAQATAGRIKVRLRTSIIETGSDLITIRDKLEHGAFGAWIALEFDFSERTAQNFMSAARFVEGKSATVADLPPAALYALAAPTASPDVVKEVLEQVEAGGRVTTAMIRDRLAGAKAIAQKQGDIARLKKQRENEKRQRAEKEASLLKWKEDQKAKAERVQEAAKFLTSKLGCSGVLEFFSLLGDAEISALKSAFHHGDWSSGRPRLLTEAEISVKFGGAL
jgi:hypothetical protein